MRSFHPASDACWSPLVGLPACDCHATSPGKRRFGHPPATRLTALYDQGVVGRSLSSLWDDHIVDSFGSRSCLGKFASQSRRRFAWIGDDGNGDHTDGPCDDGTAAQSPPTGVFGLGIVGFAAPRFVGLDVATKRRMIGNSLRMSID